MRQQFPLWLHVVLYLITLKRHFPQSRNNSFSPSLPSHQNLIAFKVLFWQEELLSCLLQKFKTFEDPLSAGGQIRQEDWQKKTKSSWCKVLHVCHVDLSTLQVMTFCQNVARVSKMFDPIISSGIIDMRANLREPTFFPTQRRDAVKHPSHNYRLDEPSKGKQEVWEVLTTENNFTRQVQVSSVLKMDCHLLGG